ncbi:putative auxin response factor domain-containing protein [Helianthus debilis subsp. tardiflorus]
MRFKMTFETEDSSRISRFMGTVSSVEVADPFQLPNSPWRLLQLYYKMLREQAHGWLKWCQVCHSFISHSSLHKERSYDSHTFDGDGIDNDVSCLLTM